MQSTEPKKYPPSTKKLKDLEKKGQFPKTDFVDPTMQLFLFIGIFIIAVVFLFDSSYLVASILIVSLDLAYETILRLFLALAFILAILKLVLFFAEWSIINRATLNTDSISFKLEKISPINGFKNIFGKEALSKSIRKVFSLLTLIFLIKYVFDISTNELLNVAQVNNKSSFVYYLIVFMVYFSFIFMVFGLIFSIVDFAFERFYFHEKNKMTYTELKNEMKETEGSPEIKSVRRNIMRDLMQTPITKGRMPNFALANPTHILIPICYDPLVDLAPVILKVTTDFNAQEERKRLQENNIPIIENKILTRAIYSKASSGLQWIPKEFYRDIAIILTKLSQHR
ncbi:EscU/YscU/HrcU family type III secretion system export apparatus switch protein [Vibrio cholerae]|uniref:EscU/YscU/HrcU family type III secretion system export apparatus switch protein n=1 Tax=Vibrio cholerae TaxID=666 RepID=UPI002DB486DC|nr:EscU/YscU/HrcU family type III secretion system export apparatus switch protein [Vibrio cholerae]MEB5517843.1 type III secretion protein [Vibrio cholerae]